MSYNQDMPAIPNPPTLGYDFTTGLQPAFPAWPGMNLDQELTKGYTFARDMVDVFAVAHQPNGQLKSASVSFDALGQATLEQLRAYLEGPLGTSVYNALVQYMRITAQGPRGYGVPTGGTPGQVVRRLPGEDSLGNPLSEWVSLQPSDVNTLAGTLTALSSAIAAETQARNTAIGNETLARTSADTLLSDAIVAESTARTTALSNNSASDRAFAVSMAVALG